MRFSGSVFRVRRHTGWLIGGSSSVNMLTFEAKSIARGYLFAPQLLEELRLYETEGHSIMAI